jgi:hypothetical protein
MKNVFMRETPIPSPNKGAFDLSFEHKTSFNLGELIPFAWYETVPGDNWRIKVEQLVKFSPLLAPLLHRVDVYAHWFYVPYRLLMIPYSNTYGGWKEFITNDPEGDYNANELPYITLNNTNKAYFLEGTLNDYLGLPTVASGTTVTQDVDINVLPHLAYNVIYDHYYRDENLIDKLCSPYGASAIYLIGGDHNSLDIGAINTLRKRAYEKDYFRGALPTAYSGAASDVELDLDMPGTYLQYVKRTASNALKAGAPTSIDVDATGKLEVGTDDVYLSSSSTAGADHMAVLEIMELRRAFAITRWLEAERRGGIRYDEMMLGVFGVRTDNMEISDPVYIGGQKQPVQISSVMNQSQVLDPTAGVNDGAGGAVVTVDPQALETGRAYSAGSGGYANYYCKEFGLIMGIASVVPRTAYTGSCIDRFWRKADREDFFVPQLQNIGDQAILQSEIGYDATGTDMDSEFGYAPRWGEYKFARSRVSGDFQSTHDYWHMAWIGDTSGAGPDLNQSFIEVNQANDENIRPFANQTAVDDRLYCDFYIDARAIRPMYVHDIPK